MAPEVEVLQVAERALLVRFHDADLSRAVARAQALFRKLKDDGLPEKGELVLGAGSLLVRLDAERVATHEEAWRERLVREVAGLPRDESLGRGDEVRIEVEFGAGAGPDLAAVSQECRLSEDEVVERLCSASLTVAFVGFSPGFPYLVGLPSELELPRLISPRPRVPAGSVAIAGPFAGIYPSATPGGWRLLGRTDTKLFDPGATPPARFAPGDRVRLVAARSR